MGGNAFNNVGRIQREDILATIDHVVSTMKFSGLTREYIQWALMGSTGKKASSGDIDIAMNTYRPRFYGEVDRPVFLQKAFSERLFEVLPKNQINTKTSSMGNLMTAWPIAGDPNKGLVQVDFIFGKADWLLWTHYSPGENESRFKGVFLTQSFGILAKMLKDYEEVDPTRTEQDGVSPLRIARCGLHLSLELGLFRSWHAEVRRDQGPSKVDPDAFETRFAKAPRFGRIGYINDPQSAQDIILGQHVPFSEINTFEKLVRWVNRNHWDPEQFKERFLNNFSKHKAMLREYSLEEMTNDEVWLLDK